MDVMHQCCAGLDVHKATVQVCVRRVDERGAVQADIRQYGTMTRDLWALSDWLAEMGVTHVAMESTGVFWKPVYHVLEGRFQVLLCNARHIKNVPGRKTDVKDCAWIAQLLQCGLLTASFVPPAAQRELRDLTRSRVSLREDQARVANRIQKVLEDANIKLGSVASDVLGVSGQAMLEALAAGETDPARLASLARGSLKQKQAELQLALEGRVTAHHRFMLRLYLAQWQQLEALRERVEAQIEVHLNGPRLNPPEGPPGTPPAGEGPSGGAVPETAPPAAPVDPAPPPAGADRPASDATAGSPPPLGYAAAAERLMEMWGIDRHGAQAILAEIGTDMRRFPSAAHLAAWAGLCPGNNESAGKRRSGRARKGSRWVRRILVQCAWAASRAKRSYFAARFRRLVRRLGNKRALLAVAHSMLRAIYHMLREHAPYRDLGADYFDQRHQERTKRSLVRRLQHLGYNVALTPAGAAS